MRNTTVIALFQMCTLRAPVEVPLALAPVGARDELGAPIEADRLNDMTRYTIFELLKAAKLDER